MGMLQTISYSGRKKGYATACLNHAKQIAEENHCYKMMLLTGSKEESTLDLLVKDAKEQGVSTIALEATDMGRALYEKYGFVEMEREMELV